MKLLLVAAASGAPAGSISLNLLTDDIVLREDYILSLRDEIYLTCLPRKEGQAHSNHFGSFTLGKARALIVQTIDAGGHTLLKISIESSDLRDFTALHHKVYSEKLGIPHEDFPRPTHRMEELSFVRGIRNDLAQLKRYLADAVRAWQSPILVRSHSG